MKKIIGCLFALMTLVVLSSNVSADCSWGSSWNSYTLTDNTPSVSFQFIPGYAGEHKIEVLKDNPFEVRTTIEWWSNAQPYWHSFVSSWYSGVHVLYAGSSDVKFRITFTKDLMKSGDFGVEWRYCMAY